MSTVTMTRPTTRPDTLPSGTASSPSITTRDKVVGGLVIGTASAITLGIFSWAIWVASGISIPV